MVFWLVLNLCPISPIVGFALPAFQGATNEVHLTDVVAPAQKADDETCIRLQNEWFEVRVNYGGCLDDVPKKGRGVLLDGETGFDETGYFTSLTRRISI